MAKKGRIQRRKLPENYVKLGKKSRGETDDDGEREMKQIVKINSSRSHNIKQDRIMWIAWKVVKENEMKR